MTCHLLAEILVNATMSHPQPGVGVQKTIGGTVGYNLAGITLLVLMLAVGGAYVVDQAGRTARPPLPDVNDADTLTQTIAGRELAIPTRWFRYGEQVRNGFASQVDLNLRLDLAVGEPPVPVQLTLLPANRARSSSTLLDAVYLHHFAETRASGVPGLVTQPLVASGGYDGETVWYDPLSGSPFVAKCMAPIEPGAEERCLRTVHLPTGLAAIFSFDRTALAHWRQFDAAAAVWLGRIGAI